MTATDWDQTTNHTDYGAPDLTGERASGAPIRRRRSAQPNYPASSVFARPEIRALVAGILAAEVAELSQSGDFRQAFLTNQLDEVVNELKGVE